MIKQLITATAIVLASASAFAQESYTVKMNMKIEGLPPEYAAFGEQEINHYVKGDKYKSENSGAMSSNTTVFDGKKLTFIAEAMGDKSGYTATKEELDAMKNDKSETKPKVEYTTEKKMIAGYECTKAIVTMFGKDKKESKVNVWTTEKIRNIENKGKSRMSMDFGDIKGMPLEIQMSQNQGGMEMKILITTSDVNTSKLEDSVFSVNTDGYKMSTYKEFQEKMKAQMGGQH